MTGFRWEIIEEYGPLFVDGALMTIKCTIICVILGTLWGLTLGLGRMAKAEHGPWKYILRYLVQFPVRFYVSAFRGTPLFVQIMVVHFALVPLFINPRDGLLVTGGLMSADFARELRASYGAFLSCIVAITLNAGAYVSEIFRAGIQSIDKGQMEASRALGAGVSPHSAAAGQQRHRHCQRLVAGLGDWPGRSGLRRAHRLRRLRHLLGTLPDHLPGLLGDHLPAGAAG